MTEQEKIKELEKVCVDCLRLKPNSEFYFRKDSGRYRDECKSCICLARTKYLEQNRDHVKQIRKRGRIKNKGKLAESNKIWRLANPNHRKEYVENNPDIIKAVAKRTYIKNKDKINQRKKEWYRNNKERHAKKRDLYAINNRDRLLAARRKWEKNRMATDINYLLQKTLRSRVKVALKSGTKKANRTEELIGCTIQKFKEYIESKFTEGMSWGNWSFYGWHLDHKIPVSWFNLENENCRKLAFHYTNMQPLWWKENFSKNNRYSHKIAV